MPLGQPFLLPTFSPVSYRKQDGGGKEDKRKMKRKPKRKATIPVKVKVPPPAESSSSESEESESDMEEQITQRKPALPAAKASAKKHVNESSDDDDYSDEEDLLSDNESSEDEGKKPQVIKHKHKPKKAKTDRRELRILKKAKLELDPVRYIKKSNSIGKKLDTESAQGAAKLSSGEVNIIREVMSCIKDGTLDDVHDVKKAHKEKLKRLCNKSTSIKDAKYTLLDTSFREIVADCLKDLYLPGKGEEEEDDG